jgi:dTMP kinase
MFITFEGIEGSGKTTQIKLLGKKLEQMGIPHLSIREPGGTPVSEKIRDILLSTSHTFENETELLLFQASRCELVRKKIIPAVLQGKVVICDRFTDSTIAYQGFGRNIPVPVIEKLNRLSVGSLKIKRTYFIDSPINKMAERNQYKIKDRIENENLNFHKRVRRGFLYLAEKYPRRILRIDGSTKIKEIHDKIFGDFINLYERTRR